MSDYIEQAQKANEQYLTALAKLQDEFAKAVTTFVKQAPKSPGPVAPTGVDLPSPREVTAVSFDFAEKLLSQQRAHTDRLIAVLAPAEVAVPA